MVEFSLVECYIGGGKLNNKKGGSQNSRYGVIHVRIFVESRKSKDG